MMPIETIPSRHQSSRRSSGLRSHLPHRSHTVVSSIRTGWLGLMPHHPKRVSPDHVQPRLPESPSRPGRSRTTCRSGRRTFSCILAGRHQPFRRLPVRSGKNSWPQAVDGSLFHALAIRHEGRFVTFDRTLPAEAVHGFHQSSLVIL